jgi:hypothetical protein
MHAHRAPASGKYFTRIALAGAGDGWRLVGNVCWTVWALGVGVCCFLVRVWALGSFLIWSGLRWYVSRLNQKVGM